MTSDPWGERTAPPPGPKVTTTQGIQNRTIFHGDNLDVLRGINTDSVDMMYIDPPFNSKRMFHAPIGSDAEGASFKDIWGRRDIDVSWEGQLKKHNPAILKVIEAARVLDDGLASYLLYMSPRLVEMERVLKPAGSFFLHCDDTAGPYLRMLCDAVFGKGRYRNTITWVRTAGRSDALKFGRVHDDILYYAGEGATWNTLWLPHDPEYVKRAYRHEDERGPVPFG